jgi:AraC-like DNA-binding protein
MRDVNSVTGARILVAASWGIGGFIQSMGGNPWSVFRRARVKPSELHDPLADISVSQHCELFEAASRETGASDFGMRFGHSLEPRMLGPIGYLAASAPTLRTALESLCQYHPAHQSGSVLSLTTREGSAALTYRVCDLDVSIVRQETEMTLAALCNIIRHALGPAWAPDLISFSHSRLHGSAGHVNVCFDRPSNSIFFREEHLDTPMPSPDAYMAGMMKSILEGRRRTSPPIDFLDQVRQRIELSLEDGSTTLARISAQLGVSEANLSTRLGQAGTTFAEILKQARCTLSLRYMRDPGSSLTEIALRLGYSELSAFSRAFQKWTGMSPQAYRQHQFDRPLQSGSTGTVRD